LQTKTGTYECAGCRKQTSVTAGTILHASKLPLTLWFWAAYLMATHSNGVSTPQLSRIVCGSHERPRDLGRVANLTDIICLYVDLPAYAVVLWHDVNSQTQRLDPHPPRLPHKPGVKDYNERR
jgi:hypothetical protein